MVLNALAVYRDPPYTYLLFMKRGGIERRNKQSEQRVRWEVALSDDDDAAATSRARTNERKKWILFSRTLISFQRDCRACEIYPPWKRDTSRRYFPFFSLSFSLSFIFFVHLALKPSKLKLNFLLNGFPWRKRASIQERLFYHSLSASSLCLIRAISNFRSL